MKIKLSSAELHDVLFFMGVNFDKKLTTRMKNRDLTLTYDRVEKELIVGCENKIKIIPWTNVAGMEPIAFPVIEQEPVAPQPTVLEAVAPTPKTIRRNLSSQASSPTDHVHAGPGAGKTNDK